MKIRTLIALTLSGVAAFSFLVAWVIGSIVAGRIVLTMISEEQVRQSSTLGAVAEVAFSPTAKPVNVLSTYMRSIPEVTPNVDYAYIEDSRGVIVYHTYPQYVGKKTADWKTDYPSATDFSSQVRSGPRTIATTHVGVQWDLGKALLADIGRVMSQSLGTFGAIGIALSVVLGVGLSFLLARPISRLAAAAQEVGRGNLSIQVPVDSGNEIGDLSRQFNSMVLRLKELDELKDEFISSVSHDLRSPLAAIKTSLDFMLEDDPERDKILERHHRTLTNVKDSANRLSVFVSNILDSAKMKANRMEYHLQPVDAAPIARSLEGLYGFAAAKEKITLSLSVPDDLPPLYADPERLERVLTNLLSNALKFTGEGGVVSLTGRVAGKAVELSVADTGQGIPAEALPLLFRRFEQASIAEQKAKGIQGTGLGLFIVKQSVEAMGGVVEIESEVGKGTKVAVRLPIATQTDGEAPAPLSAPASASAFVAYDPRVSAKILLVDDDRAFAEVTRQLLESKGYTALTLNDGRRALEVAMKEKPDLVLLDMNLRDMRGLDVARALKGEGSTARIPIILCSAHMDLAEIQKTLEAGADCFIPKPIRSAELDVRVRQVLGARSGA
ncbi:MAG: hybrid sensor histidine kinase/response regulator [Elusimicrobia bacterium]|nr:hybrid sensor histidine kinase/response regulator [Elusimicrobiota bacterium]